MRFGLLSAVSFKYLQALAECGRSDCCDSSFLSFLSFQAVSSHEMAGRIVPGRSAWSIGGTASVGAGGGCIVRRSSHGPEIRPITCVGTGSAEGEVSWCAAATPPGAGSLFHDAGLAADCAPGVGLWP